LQEAPEVEEVERRAVDGWPRSGLNRSPSSVSLRELFQIIVRRRRLVLLTIGGLLAACLFYCLIAPREYDARARVALRTTPATSLNFGEADQRVSASFLSTPLQTETVAGVLRSDRLAWKVILDERLYQSPAFTARFAARFPDF
jgi:uncharacterized protein involved in exopolysaccharide biosynthesis